LVTLIGVSYCLASYPVGILSDRVSRRLLLSVGLAINGLAFIGLGFAPNYVWSIFWCVVAGIGGSAYHPAATAMLVGLYPDQIGRVLGKVAIGAAIGFWIGPVYSGWRAETAGWREPMIELGIFGILGAVLFFWLTPASLDVVKKRTEHKTFPKLSGKFWIWIWFFSLTFGCRDFAGAGMGTLSSLFLQKVHGFNVGMTGQILGWMFLSAIVSNPLFGKWSDRSRTKLICFVLFVSAILVLSIPWLSRFWVPIVLVIYGFFFLANYPIFEAAFMESIPERVRGQVFGLFIAISGVFGGLSHWLMGAWVNSLKEQSQMSYVPLFSTLGFLIAISVVAMTFLKPIQKHGKF